MLALILMEVGWAAPWYRGITGFPAEVESPQLFLTLTGTLVLAYLTGRLVAYFRLNRNARRGIVAVLVLASLIIASRTLSPPSAADGQASGTFREVTALLPDNLWMLAGMLGLWWYGLGIANLAPGVMAVSRRFRWGAILLLLLQLVETPATGQGMVSLTRYVFFLASALFAMILGRIWSVSRLRGGRRISFDREWLIGMAVSVFGVVALAAGLAGALSQTLALWVRRLTSGLVEVVIFAVSRVILLIVSLIPEAFFSWGVRIRQVLEETQEEPFTVVQPPPEVTEAIEVAPTDLPNLGPWLVWGGVLLFVIFLIFRLGEGIQWRRGEMEEERESLLSREAVLLNLRKSVQARLEELAARFRRSSRLSRRQRARAALRIREIYAQLMETSADLGTPRPAAATPLEFLPALRSVFPDRGPDLETITRAYLRVRYGELPETRSEVEAVESAWGRVQARARALEKDSRIRAARSLAR